MRDATIVGIGMTQFGRHPELSHVDLTQQAVRLALADSGVTPSAIQMAVYANVVQGFVAGEMSIPGEYALRPLEIEGVRAVNVEAACASSTIGLHLAVDYVRMGLADIVLVVGVEKLYSDDRAKRFAVFQQPRDIEEARAYLAKADGLLAPVPPEHNAPSPNVLMEAYAAMARLHMATYGTTQRQIAAVAAKNHGHSQHNPLSQYREPMTVEQVLAAPVVTWPLTNPMCAPISDGAAAAIVCSPDIAARLGGARAIRVLAAESQTGRDRLPADYANHVTRLVSARAYERAGIGPTDIDLAEVHDASSSGEIVQTEALGLCAPGEAGGGANAARRRLEGGSRSTCRAGWCRRGIRSARPASGKSTNSSLNCAGRPARDRSPTRGSRWPRIRVASTGWRTACRRLPS